MMFRKRTSTWRGFDQVPRDVPANQARDERRHDKKDLKDAHSMRKEEVKGSGWNSDTTVTNPQRSTLPQQEWEE